MCSGTDCAEMCAQGQCYADEMQRQQAEEAAYWEGQYNVEESARINQALAPRDDDPF